jgi:hypothetical protein
MCWLWWGSDRNVTPQKYMLAYIRYKTENKMPLRLVGDGRHLAVAYRRIVFIIIAYFSAT